MTAPAVTERHLRIAREESLRKRLLARDEQALVELIEWATPWLLGVTEGILQDSADAEEVVMETFRQAWDRAESIAETGFGLMPWLLRVARNRAIDRVRTRRRHSLGTARLAEELAHDVPFAVAEPDEAGTPGWHVHDSVHRALNALPSDQRTAVQLAYFSGLSQSEIAESLGIPLGTVKSRMRMGFDKLRHSLASVRDWTL